MFLFKKKEIIKTNKNYSDYLPCGSIIKIKNDESKYMISRYLGNACMAISQKDEILIKSHLYNLNSTDKRYYCLDYEIVNYPEGDTFYYILHDDIENIIYLGYSDEYRKNILMDLDNWNNEGE